MKKKNEEIEAKLYSLRNEKMELHRKVSEIQSTLDSLKEEQSIMEITFEEKQKEIQMLREKDTKWGKENAHVISLSERLKQKEAQIEDLKLRDAANLVLNQRLAEQQKTETTEGKGNEMESRESRYRSVGDQTLADDSSMSALKFNRVDDENVDEKSRYRSVGDQTLADDSSMSAPKFNRVDDENVDAKESIDRREMTSTEMLKDEKSDDDDDDGTSVRYAGERVKNEGTGEEDVREKVVEAKEDIASMQLKKYENPVDVRAQGIDLDGKDGLKQKMEDNGRVASNFSGKVRPRRGQLRRGRAKRWRAKVKSELLGNNELSESNGAVVRMRNRNVYKDEKDRLRDVWQGASSSDETTKRDGEDGTMVADNSIQVSAEDKVLKVKDGNEIDGDVAKERLEEVQGWIGRHIRKQDSDTVDKNEDFKVTQDKEGGQDEEDDGDRDGYAKELDSNNEDAKNYKDK